MELASPEISDSGYVSTQLGTLPVRRFILFLRRVVSMNINLDLCISIGHSAKVIPHVLHVFGYLSQVVSCQRTCLGIVRSPLCKYLPLAFQEHSRSVHEKSREPGWLVQTHPSILFLGGICMLGRVPSNLARL